MGQNEAEVVNKYLRWTREMDKLLLDLLKEEKAKGNKDEKQFTKEAWKNVISLLNVEFHKLGKSIDKAKAVNRLKTIKDQMALAVELLERKSCFGWDPTTMKIGAEPSAWDGVIRAKPDYKNLRGKELYFLDDARELFGKDRAKGANAESAKEKVQRWQQEKDPRADDIDEVNMEAYIDSLDSYAIPASPIAQQSASSNPNCSRETARATKRKKTMSDTILNAISEFTSSIKDIVNAIISTNAHIYTAKEICMELKKLGMEKWELMEALDFLMDNGSLVERFFVCDDDMKLDWLKKKMDQAIGTRSKG